jgi:DNA-binding transcriptional regulator YbjK
MGARREEVLDAAIQVLGTRGMRGLTHRAVDVAANLPLGSTSNCFRSRDALIAGILERLNVVAKEGWFNLASQFGVDGQLEEGNIDRFAEVLGLYLKYLTGPGRIVTLACHAIYTEAAIRPELQPLVVKADEELAGWGAEFLRQLGLPNPTRNFWILMALIDGLMARQLAAPDPSFEPIPAIRALLHGLRT